MKIKLQVLSGSLTVGKSNSPIDLFSEGYSLISDFLYSLRDKVSYRSRRRVYVSKKTGEVKEYYSQEEFSLNVVSYDVDLLYPGGPLIILDADNVTLDRRFKIVKRFLHEKAKKLGLAIYIFPYYRSALKRKILGCGDEVYQSVSGGFFFEDRDRIANFLSLVHKNKRYVDVIPDFIHVFNWINYLFSDRFPGDFRFSPLFFRGEPFKEARDLYLKYLNTKDVRYLNSFFVLLNPNFLTFRAISDAYCISGGDGIFLERYLGLPFISSEDVQIEIRNRVYSSLFVQSEKGFSGFYSKLREVVDYLMFISTSFDDFVSKVSSIFRNARFYHHYFVFSFRSISDVYVSFESLGFRSLDDLKSKIGNVPIDRILSVNKGLKQLLDELEYSLLSSVL